ncbi:MAG: DUF262 domain-containing protein [Gemmatimonadota bacterium]|jgi:hypothetical protein|nr:DUF262 domain-containing protein [Gemmatimonadota bacterium]
MRTVTYDLRTLLDEAQRGTFVIPRFQREFVWKLAQIKLLIDSVARNFPIGSLLLLEETNIQNPFLMSRSIQSALDEEEAESSAATIETQTKRFYVLDGQQRLTSLVQVFLQANSTQNYYFDLYKLSKQEESQIDWVITKRKSQSVPRRYLHPEVVRDAEKCQILVEEYFENDEPSLKGDRTEQRKASARVNRVFETMRNYQAPVVIIDRSESREAICRIFETINSTGTRLTTFDLAVARFFPEPDLHRLLSEAREKHDILNRYSIEGERILQVVAASDHMERSGGVIPEITRSAILDLDRQTIIDRWGTAVVNLARAYEWVEDHGAVPGILANENLLVPLALFLGTATDQWKRDTPGCMATLERWYFANSLQQGARQASNYRASQNISNLCHWVKNGTALPILSFALDLDELLKLKKTDNRYGAILSLLRWKCKSDLWTDEQTQPDDVEDHHIFPSALHRRNGLNKRFLDSVANRLLVSKSTNRYIKDRSPQDYMERMWSSAAQNGTLTKKKALLHSACIPVYDTKEEFIAQFNPVNFEIFIRNRADLILGIIKEVVGDALQQTSSETQDDEGNMDAFTQPLLPYL